MDKKFKITGFILGITSMFFCLGAIAMIIIAGGNRINAIPALIIGVIAEAMAIVGLVLSIVGNNKKRTVFGSAAFVLCLLAIILVTLLVVICGLAVFFLLTE